MNLPFELETVFSTYPYNLILLGIVLLSIIVALISISIALSAKRRISRLMHGKNAKDIDEVLIHVYKNISALDQFRQKAAGDMEQMNVKLARATQSIETIRFNPFKGTGAGGNQSFATAMLNENGDGVVISSLYSSDRVSIFAKPIVKLASTYELTEEEMQAIRAAADKIR